MILTKVRAQLSLEVLDDVLDQGGRGSLLGLPRCGGGGLGMGLGSCPLRRLRLLRRFIVGGSGDVPLAAFVVRQSCPALQKRESGVQFGYLGQCRPWQEEALAGLELELRALRGSEKRAES